MKTTLSFLSKKSWVFLLAPLLLLIPEASVAQTDTEAAVDMAILPWLGIWKAMDENPASQMTTLEIRPGADVGSFDIVTKDTDQPVSENIIPDGVSRPVESKNCTGTRVYQWEKQAGVLLGTSEIACQGEASFSIFNLKMMTSADRMADILVIKTSDQTRLAVRRFAFEKELSAAGDFFQARESMVLRTNQSAPWDLDKIISLSKTVETVVLEAALLEKNLQVKLDSKSLRKMKSTGTPDSIIDLLVAMSAPNKFRIEKNEQIAVEAASPSRLQNSEAYSYAYRMESPYYYGYYFPWSYYWSYNSPFWWGYPIYAYYPGFIAGGGSIGGGNDTGGGGSGSGGGNGTGGGSSDYSGGRLSSGSGYVQITPGNTGHQAVPRGSVAPGAAGYATPSGRGAGYSGTGAGYVSSSSSYSAGAVSSSSGGGSVSSGTSASPSGYSGGGSGGTAVPR